MDIDRILEQEDASCSPIEPPSSPPPFLAPPIPRRKRTRAPDASTPSSDGPLFSSDPPDPSIDEYYQPRRKRQYRGTWWGEITRADTPTEPAATQRTKNGFTRNMDSGIWMGSDATEEDLGSDFPELDLPRGDVGRHAVARLKISDILEATTARDTEADQAVELAQSKLQHFLENNDENIALGNIGLKALPVDFFEPLQTLYRDPSPFDPENSEGETEVDFQARGILPRIRLDLSNNAFDFLPSSLFDLQNITKLNLSHNNLTQLSRHIGKLRNLATLDISSNRLRWLPWELIQLIQQRKLRMINLDCNPFLQPFSYVSCFDARDPWTPPATVQVALSKIRGHVEILRSMQQSLPFNTWIEQLHYNQADEHFLWMIRFCIRYLTQASPAHPDMFTWESEPPRTTHIASTLVARFEPDGRLMSGQPKSIPSLLPIDEFVFPAAIAKDQLTWVVKQLTHGNLALEELDAQVLQTLLHESESLRQHETLRKESSVPSLFELALRSATKGAMGEEPKYDITDLLSMIREDDPESVRQGIYKAIDVNAEGGRVCSVCSKSFVLARTEWIEYWYLGESASTDHTKTFVPILRRGCSPNCGPGLI